MHPPIADVMNEASSWIDIRGVEAVGQGKRNGRDCIEVKISDPEAGRRIPTSLHGYPVFVEISGPIQAQ